MNSHDIMWILVAIPAVGVVWVFFITCVIMCVLAVKDVWGMLK